MLLQSKQIDRTVAKVMRLKDVYLPRLVTSETEQSVSVVLNGKRIPATSGLNWGKEFAYATFSFEARGVERGKKYYLVAETGGTEHLISVNGRKIGLIDKLKNERDGIFRIHERVLLDGLKNGDKVDVEAYYSHTFPGTMPYEEPSTFSMDGLYPVRPFNKISLVTLWEPLAEFLTNLDLLNKRYLSQNENTFARAETEKAFVELFKILPMQASLLTERELNLANEFLTKHLSTPAIKPLVGIIGHSHLDTAWLWKVEETRHKLHRTLSNAVTLLNRYPEYKFFLSTVLYLKWIEEDDPVLFAEVKRLVAEGRIEPNGSTWVECDGNLTGAEPMCRQFVRGKRYLRQKLGFEADAFWLPDTFGYSAALPQIMASSGVKYFLTTKLSWNDTNRFPYETFRWQGIDGTAVTTHFNTIQSWVDEQSVAKRLNDVHNKRESNCALMAYGFGDGGGGPSDEMVKQAVITEKTCNFADVRHVTVSEFMDKVSEQNLPTYYGELYLELHRGTFTTNHALKRNNRRLEEALHDAELVSVFAGEDNKAKTDELYDVLMLNQFHDILPGTCIAEATDIAIAEQTQAIAQAKKICAGVGDEARYFNTLGFARRELLPSSSGVEYVDLDGNKQTLALFEFAPCGYGKQTETKAKLTFDGKRVVTSCYQAEVEGGVITSLVFNGRELVKTAFGTPIVAEDVPYIYDNWDIDADYKLKERQVDCLTTQVVVNCDRLVVLRSEFRLTENSTLLRDIIFRADSPIVEFDNKLIFADKHTLARTYFDTTLFAEHYRTETQFGTVERNALPHGVADAARFEVCSHKWTDLSEKNVGISLLSDSKYGVSVEGGKIGLTLHKSGTHPDARGDNGTSRFRYAILPHDSGIGMETVQAGYDFNLRPILTNRQNLSAPFVVSGDETVVTETVKQGEDGGVAIRLYECLGATATVTVTSDKYKRIALCNLLEDEECVLSNEGHATITFSPYKIVTLVLR